MKRSLLAFSFVFLFLLTLGGCGDEGGQKAPAPDPVGQAMKGVKVTVVTAGDNPPFESRDTSTGQLKGFDIDLIHLIARELNAELELMDQDFSAIIPSLQARKADFSLAMITPSESRRRSVDFSLPYLKAESSLVFKAEAKVKGMEYLEGKTIAAQLGAVQADIANEIGKRVKGVTVTLYNKIGEVIEAVKSGRAYAAVVEKTSGDNLSHLGLGLDQYVLGDEFTHTLAIAYPKGSSYRERIDQILERMKKEGVLEELRKKWLGTVAN